MKVKRMSRIPVSNMNRKFHYAWYDYAHDSSWLCWIGMPMVYDGALFVTREGF